VLLALLVPALWAQSVWPFALLTLMLLAAAGWEWGRLNGASQTISLTLASCLLLACAALGPAAVQRTIPNEVWFIWAAGWILGGAGALRRGILGWQGSNRQLRWALGVLLLWGAWAALVSARAQGLAFVLSVLCLVWVADVAAYFGGRAFGRRKLAPSISPGKSWEGVWSGVVGVALLAWAWVTLGADAGPSVYSLLLERYGWVGGGALLMLLCGLSVVGDLFESLVKRAAGMKDSSQLLPGHGGVLDRIDALLPVFPLALALTLA
ncbi:MAG: phosphatidate cytidylyltransferase, partial [Rubrivivax sp.]